MTTAKTVIYSKSNKKNNSGGQFSFIAKIETFGSISQSKKNLLGESALAITSLAFRTKIVSDVKFIYISLDCRVGQVHRECNDLQFSVITTFPFTFC